MNWILDFGFWILDFGCFSRKKHVEPRAFRQSFQNLISCGFGRIFFNFAPADVAKSLTDTREKKPQVIVNFCLGGDSRTRIARRVFLPNRNGGRDADNLVNIAAEFPGRLSSGQPERTYFQNR